MCAIGPGDVLDGEIFLYKDARPLGRLITFLDGTDYCHAGLYLEKTGKEVGEAISQGVVAQSVAASIRGRIGVDVYRLKERPDMIPAVQCGRAYIAQGLSYATSTLVLCAFLCIARRATITPKFKVLARFVLDRATAWLIKRGKSGKKSMICSEFVYRCYTEPFKIKGRTTPLGLSSAKPAEGSLLAAFTSESLLQVAKGPMPLRQPKRPVRQAPMAFDSGPEGDERDPALDSLISEYLEEVRDQRITRLSAAQLPALWSSAERFATAFLEHSEPYANQPFTQLLKDQTALQLLAANVPNFVTPGDLSKDPALRNQGAIAPGAW